MKWWVKYGDRRSRRGVVDGPTSEPITCVSNSPGVRTFHPQCSMRARTGHGWRRLMEWHGGVPAGGDGQVRAAVALDDVAAQRVHTEDGQHELRPAEGVGGFERHLQGEVPHQLAAGPRLSRDLCDAVLLPLRSPPSPVVHLCTGQSCSLSAHPGCAGYAVSQATSRAASHGVSPGCFPVSACKRAATRRQHIITPPVLCSHCPPPCAGHA